MLEKHIAPDVGWTDARCGADRSPARKSVEVMEDADQLEYEARFKQLGSALTESRVAFADLARSAGGAAGQAHPNCPPTWASPITRRRWVESRIVRPDTDLV